MGVVLNALCEPPRPSFADHSHYRGYHLDAWVTGDFVAPLLFVNYVMLLFCYGGPSLYFDIILPTLTQNFKILAGGVMYCTTALLPNALGGRGVYIIWYQTHIGGGSSLLPSCSSKFMRKLYGLRAFLPKQRV